MPRAARQAAPRTPPLAYYGRRLARILRAAEVPQADADLTFTNMRKTLGGAYKDLLDRDAPPDATLPQLLAALETVLGLPPPP